MILITRRDAVNGRTIAQAGDIQGQPYVTVGTTESTVWLNPEDARDFGRYLIELADRVAEQYA